VLCTCTAQCLPFTAAAVLVGGSQERCSSWRSRIALRPSCLARLSQVPTRCVQLPMNYDAINTHSCGHVHAKSDCTQRCYTLSKQSTERVCGS
jgi:hypothetical protein